MRDSSRERPTRVLHVGPGWGQKGGIASVMNELKTLTDAFSAHDVQLQFCETHGFRQVTGVLRFFCADVPHFARRLASVDIVHLHSSADGSFYRKFFLFAIARLFKKRIVFHLHSGNFSSFTRRSNRFVMSAVYGVLRDCCALVGVSGAIGDELVALGGERARLFIIGNTAYSAEKAFATSPVSLPLPTGKPVNILFAGRLSETKGVGELLEAVAALARQGLDPHVTFLGTGDIERWRQHAKRLSIDARVSFPGWLDGEEKLERFRSAQIFCMPSHFESFGIATLEAMFAGLAVVGTTVGGFFDLVEPGRSGYLVPPLNPAELERALSRLIQDPTLTAEMGRCGKKRAYTRFSCEVIAMEYVSMYRQVMRG